MDPIIDKKGNETWHNEAGELHREDGPAVIRYINSISAHEPIWMKWWYVNGVRHRDNGPAIERSNGKKVWYRYGNIHRDEIGRAHV